MSLNRKPARPLTSREIAKVVAAVLGGFVDWCGADPVIEAMNHFIEYHESYIDTWKDMEKLTKKMKSDLMCQLEKHSR